MPSLNRFTKPTAGVLEKHITAVLSRDPLVDRRSPLYVEAPDSIERARISSIDVSDLPAIAHPGEFLRQAHLRVSGREPDAAELDSGLRLLDKYSRAYVLHLLIENATAENRQLRFHGQWTRHSTAELLRLNGPALVKEAFRSILWRNPNLDEYAEYLWAAARSRSAETVLAALASSPEAAAYPRLEGLPVELSDVASAPGDEVFVRRAYQVILGRDPDPSGFRSALGSLRWMSRRRVVLALARSPEARERGTRFLWQGRPLEGPAKWAILFRPALWRQTAHAQISAFVDSLLMVLYRRVVAIEEAQSSFAQILERLRAQAATQLEDNRLQTERQTTSFRQIQEINARLESLDRSGGFHTRRLDDLEQVAVELSRQSVLHTRRLDTLVEAGQSVSQQLEGLRERVPARAEIDSIVHGRVQSLATILREASAPQPAISLGDRLLVTRVGGYVMAMPAEDVLLTASLAMYGSVDAGLVAFLTRTLQPGDTFVDVGAHIGLHTLPAAATIGASGHVYSFEPTPRTFDILATNVVLNGFASRVSAHQAAVSDGAGQVAFTISDSSGHNSLYGLPEGTVATQVQVRTTALDDALAEVRRIDVVKIDAEGAEPAILRGMRGLLTRHRGLRVIVEFAPSLLERAGVAPREFACRLDSEFRVARVDDLTGELSAIAVEDLLAFESSNLLLEQRS